MTFREIILRVAIAAGVAVYPSGSDNSPTIPADPATLALLKIAINDGRRAFYAETANRVPGGTPRAWRFMRPRFDVTLATTAGPKNIDGDISRYRLPADVQGPPDGDVRCGLADTSGYGHALMTTSMDAVDAHHFAQPEAEGPPLVVAFERARVGETAGDEPAWEMRVWPLPDQAYTVRSRMTRRFRDLVDLNDVEPSPHPQAVIAYAIYELVRSTLGVDVGKATLDRDTWLDRARIQDAAESPTSLGVSYDPGVRAAEQGLQTGSMDQRPWVGMTDVFGVAV